MKRYPRFRILVAVLVLCAVAFGMALLFRVRSESVHKPAVSSKDVRDRFQNGPTPVPQAVVPEPALAREGVEFSDDRVTEVDLSGMERVDGMYYFRSPFEFAGTTTAFENQFAWRVRDGKGTVLAEGTGYASSSDMGVPGPFLIRGIFSIAPTAPTGTLDVFEASAKDGTPIHDVHVPVVLWK